MPRHLIPGFTHKPGRHCGSTSMADVLRHAGVALSEAMCFGLGSGLAFLFMHDSGSPSRYILGRGYLLESDLCEALGVDLREEREADPSRAWERVRERVDAGVPVILSTDLKHLPYWGPQAGSFNGHRVVLAGYNDGVALVADTDKPGLKEVTLADLARSRASEGPPVGYTENVWWELKPRPTRPPLREAIERALRTQAERLLRDPSGFGGCDALDRFAAELPGWRESLRDFPAVAVETYRNIEKRGTGGGLFRRLYADFLAECESEGYLDPSLGLGRQAAQIAAGWTEVALALRATAQGQDRLSEATAKVAWLAGAERVLATALEHA